MNNMHIDATSVKLTEVHLPDGSEFGKNGIGEVNCSTNPREKCTDGILVYKGESKEETVSVRGKQKFAQGGIEAFRDFDWKPMPEFAGTVQSTENEKRLENSANTPLTNVRHGSIIPVLLLTNSEYYSFGGCIL